MLWSRPPAHSAGSILLERQDCQLCLSPEKVVTCRQKQSLLFTSVLYGVARPWIKSVKGRALNMLHLRPKALRWSFLFFFFQMEFRTKSLKGPTRQAAQPPELPGSHCCSAGPQGQAGWGLQARDSGMRTAPLSTSQLSSSFPPYKKLLWCRKSHWFHLKLFPNRIWTLKQILSSLSELLCAGASQVSGST